MNAAFRLGYNDAVASRGHSPPPARVNKSSHRTFKDVQAAFESRRILHCSRKELAELLVAAAADTPADAAGQARAHEMGATMRELLAAKSRPRRPWLAALAAVLALLALLVSGVHAYYSRTVLTAEHESVAALADYIRATSRDEVLEDPCVQLTLEELARRAPTLSTGTLQAWWAGEQARSVQRLEALAKRQTLAGDREGAARTVRRADAIRTGIAPVAKFGQPPAN
ncbi:MAG TPA: hypothetical protein VK993_15065 [Chthoniobacterales bacterium]|nr:hypothetical protein [Chthoniobacterales bacterium]